MLALPPSAAYNARYMRWCPCTMPHKAETKQCRRRTQPTRPSQAKAQPETAQQPQHSVQSTGSTPRNAPPLRLTKCASKAGAKERRGSNPRARSPSVLEGPPSTPTGSPSPAQRPWSGSDMRGIASSPQRLSAGGAQADRCCWEHVRMPPTCAILPSPASQPPSHVRFGHDAHAFEYSRCRMCLVVHGRCSRWSGRGSPDA
jgi:hypothetical protein